jgi:thiol-disulfide isomerase/thioredoxin
MRKPFYIFLALMFLISCSKKENESPTINVSASNISEINLKLKNYDPEKDKNFIDIKVENVISPIKEQLTISVEGIVNYTFINNNKKEIIFNYDNRKFSLIISPSEKIDIELKISELLNWSRFNHIKVSGINETTNRLILANTSYLDSLIKLSTSSSVKDSLLNNLRYKNRRISEMKTHLQTFNNYITDKKIKNLTFIDWGKAQIRYKAGKDLCVYPFLGKRNKNLTAEDEYFNFVDGIKFNSNDELVYDSYLNYLKSLAKLYIIMANVGETYNDKVELLEKNWPTPYFLKIELVKKLPKGKDREIMMAYLFKNEQRISNHFGRKTPNEYSDSLKLYANKTLVAQLNQTKEIDTTSILKLIANYDLSLKEKEELIKIYKRTKGKVVFHDFWFTNCPPCMKELPHYNDLISTTDGENVEFIFYGVYMENEEWKKTIDKFKLKGNHYLLTKNQLAFFEKYFRVHAFPHHQLINSSGKIGKKIPFGVYPNNFEEIKKLIKKHQVGNNNGV